MRWAQLGVLVSVFVCAVYSAPVQAQEAPQENKALAQEHYNAGLRAYNVGEFDQAIKDWKAAYQYLGAPDFLFNIAQAYRQKRDYAQAVFFYNSYLRGKPEAANVAEVTALRDEMQALLDAQASTETLPPMDVVDPNATETAATPTALKSATETASEIPGQGASAGAGEVTLRDSPPPSDGKTLRLVGVIAGGTGVAFVATGIAFALFASSTESDLEKAAANGEAWSDEFSDMEDSAERSATIGTVLIVTGVVAIVGGAATYYFGRKKREEAKGLAGATVTPTVALDSEGARAGLTMGWNF